MDRILREWLLALSPLAMSAMIVKQGFHFPMNNMVLGDENSLP